MKKGKIVVLVLAAILLASGSQIYAQGVKGPKYGSTV
jgi:hypothetical protein